MNPIDPMNQTNELTTLILNNDNTDQQVININESGNASLVETTVGSASVTQVQVIDHVDIVSPVSAQQSIYWNAQSEETFLQTLFANTLLNDDFPKDFDSLGLDNLQLNYSNNVNNEHSDQLTSTSNKSPQQTSKILSTAPNENQATSLPTNNIDLLNSCIIVNSSDLEIVSITNKQLDTNDQFKTLLNEPLIEQNQNTINSQKLDLIKDSSSSLNVLNANPLNFLNDDEDDDNKLFKRPLDLDNFYKRENSNEQQQQKQIINLFESIDLMSEIKLNNKSDSIDNGSQVIESVNATPAKLTMISLDDLKVHLSNETSSFIKEPHSIASSMTIRKQSNKKEKSIEKSQQLFQSKTSDVHVVSPSTEGSFLNKNSGCFTTSSSINKFLNLKRSRKRSKLLNGLISSSTKNQSTNANQIIINSTNSKESSAKTLANIKQTKLGSSATTTALLNSNKSNSKKLDKITSKEKLKQQQFNKKSSNSSFTLNFEPSNKKFAIDCNFNQINPIISKETTTTISSKQAFKNDDDPFINANIVSINASNVNGNKKLGIHVADNSINVNASNLASLKEMIKSNLISVNSSLKKDEVDLDIKDLSLLDLHSSEDDSVAEFLKKDESNKNKLKKNIRSSSNDHNTLIHSPPLTSFNEKSINNNLNEIITKRIKYSPATTASTTSLTSQENVERRKSSSNEENNITLLSKNEQKESKIDKLIQYLAKSFDSTSNNNSSNINANVIINSNSNNTNSIITRHHSSTESFQPAKNQNNSHSISISSLSSLNSNSSTCSIVSPSSSSNKIQNKRKKNEQPIQITSSKNQNTIASSTANNKLNDNQIVFVSLKSSSSSSTINNNPSNQYFSNILDTPSTSLTINAENDETIQNMKNLDINNDFKKKLQHQIIASDASSINNTLNEDTCDLNLKLNLNDSNSRNYLWNLLKSHSTQDELKHQFGSMLHDKLSFWDLVELKLKFTNKNHLKTTYEIIEDYTVLYSNMSTLLEKIVKENSNSTSKKNNAGENSSRSRSSSRNCRKQSTTSIK